MKKFVIFFICFIFFTLNAQGAVMSLNDLKKEQVLINNFCNLAEIPSPSLKEENVAKWIIKYLEDNGIEAYTDAYGNVIAKIKATDTNKKPILFSSHMDVIGDDSPVNIKLSGDGKFIETDKKRTLGADDKAGVAVAITIAAEIQKDKSLKHGGLELIFTRDEEKNMSGAKHLNLKDIESKYLLVLDSDKLGDVLISGAGYTNLYLTVKSAKSGHSGNDIHEKDRLNAVKLISELTNKIPQGVYKKNKLGTITSINIGAIVGGGVQNCVQEIAQNNIINDNYVEYITKNSATNIINNEAMAIYSVRSSEKDTEEKLLTQIEMIVDRFNKKYEPNAKATIKTEEHLPIFEKSEDNYLEILGKSAEEKSGVKIRLGSFHAGAETHHFASKTNKFLEPFSPALIGIADIYNMHSADEKIDVESFLKGYKLLKALFYAHNGI